MTRPNGVLLIAVLLAVGCLAIMLIRDGPRQQEIEKLLSEVKTLKAQCSDKPQFKDTVACTKSDETDVRNTENAMDGMTQEEFIQKINNDLEQQEDGAFVITNHHQAISLLKWDFEKPPEYECKNTTKGGVYYICHDPPFTVKPPCLVYSFGIYREWGFDEHAGGKLGCEAHAFDPSIPHEDHIHKKVVHFHKIGIGSVDTDTYEPPRGLYVKSNQTWKMRTLPSLMKMLGHEGKVIDILKVDVEGWEWAILEQLMESGIIHRVRQFLVEWHWIRDFPKKKSYIHLLKLYYKLKEAGFKIFGSNFRTNGYNEKRWRLQSDAWYLNFNFKGA